MRTKNQITVTVSLRPWAAEDLPLLQQLMGDPAMTEHLGGPETPEVIAERHARYLRTTQSGAGAMFVIQLGSKRVPVGSIGYWERNDQGLRVWEMGWGVLTEFQGYGVATQAVAQLMLRARQEGRHRFVHAFPSVDNAASNALCKRAGFVLLGQADFEYPPGHMLRCNDWRLDLFEGVA